MENKSANHASPEDPCTTLNSLEELIFASITEAKTVNNLHRLSSQIIVRNNKNMCLCQFILTVSIIRNILS